jgi:hypothetical protein
VMKKQSFVTVGVVFALFVLGAFWSSTIDVKKMIRNNLYGLMRSELLGVETHEA